MDRTFRVSLAALCALLMLGCPSDDDDDKDAGESSGGASQGGNGEGDDTSGGASGENDATSGDPVVDERCATVRCAAGTHCEVTEVDCINDPCEPTIACVVDDDQTSCVLADCAPGYECIMDPVTGARCVLTDPEPVCSPACSTGTHCEYIEVQCVQPPCDPVATCVADDACENVKCEAGKACQLLYPPCAQPPDGGVNPNCVPQPVCVSAVPCGNTFCTGGQQCCNASCGICADLGMACIQIAC